MITPPTIPPRGDPASPHLDEDALLELLFGRLPAADRASALNHLLACPECEDVFRQRGRRFERLRATSVYRDLLRDGPIPEGMADTESSPESTMEGTGGIGESSAVGKTWRGLRAIFRQPRYIVGLATGLATVVAVLLMISHPAERIVLPSETNWLPGGSELTGLRGEPSLSNSGSIQNAPGPDGDHATGDLLRALDAYGRRDLGSAIQGLQSARTTGPLESIRLIYLGNALAHQGKFAEATETLQAALHKKLPEGLREEGLWTLLVALHRTGQHASADSLFKVLTGQPGEVGDRARSLLGHHGPKDFNDHR